MHWFWWWLRVFDSATGIARTDLVATFENEFVLVATYVPSEAIIATYISTEAVIGTVEGA